MDTLDYKPGTYVVISEDNANIRREPRIVEYPSNIVGQHTPGTQVEVFEIFVDKKMMVWGRTSAVHPGNGKANWMCIHTGNRANLKAVVQSASKTIKLVVGDVTVFEMRLGN